MKKVYFMQQIESPELLNKARKSLYKKGKVFYEYYLDLENKNVLYESEKPKTIAIYTPFVEQRKVIDRSSALYSIKAPFELVHADVAVF